MLAFLGSFHVQQSLLVASGDGMGAIIARLFFWRREIEEGSRRDDDDSVLSDDGSTDSLLHHEQVSTHLQSPSPPGGGESETDEPLIESLPLDILLKYA